MRKFLLTIVAVVAAGLVVVAVAAPGSYRGYEPVVVAGAPSCKDLAGLDYSAQVKFVSPVNGASADGITLFIETSRVGWYILTEHNVRAIIVKGGPNANVYFLPEGVFSDGLLTPPSNPKSGKAYGLSYVTFCYDPPA
jgi:hypothetical protein